MSFPERNMQDAFNARTRHRVIQSASFIVAINFSLNGGKTVLKACAQTTWNFTKECIPMEIAVGLFTAFILSISV